MDTKAVAVELGPKLSSEMVEELGRLRMVAGHQTSLLREALFKIKNLTQYNRDLSTRLSGFEDAMILVKAGGTGRDGSSMTSGRDVTYDIERHLEEISHNAGVQAPIKSPRGPMSEKQKKKISATQKRRNRAKKKAAK